MQNHAAATSRAAFQLATDPITEARTAIRRAVLVPFEASHAQEWAKQFGRYLSSARRALSWHGSSDDDPLTPDARPSNLIDLKEARHADLMQRCADLLDRLGEVGTPDLWDMVEICEAAKLLERDIEAYRRSVSTGDRVPASAALR